MKVKVNVIKYVIFVLTGIFLLTNSNFRKLVKNYFKLHKVKKQEIALDSEYEKMKQQKIQLEKDDSYLERVARYELNVTKKNEYEFRFTPPEENDKH
ncbi:MAG TPA: septum formation initiator family protein [Elusimicrobiales bacterium]|nr:septum formation initiator family protein [Elusimicrobiales bacterium]